MSTTRADIAKDQLVTKGDLRAELAELRAEIAPLRWMLGFNLVLSFAILGKMLV